MSELALVGDIGGTNSRFGLVEPGSTTALDIEALKNDRFGSLEDAAAHYLDTRNIASLSALAVAIAGPVTGETVSLTNRAWSFTHASLARAARACTVRILNDFEALALSLPHLGGGDLVQIGGRTPEKPGVKIVLGLGTGLGMATLAPLPQGGWMALPGELGHITLPGETREEFELREALTIPGVIFESEDAITGGGLLRIYRTIARMAGRNPAFETPEQVLQAALARSNDDAVKTLRQFIVWLARLSGDAAMIMQAHGGVYLAGGIAPSIVGELQEGSFRRIFQEKGRLARVMRPIPVYVITDRYPALKGCAAALAEIR